MYFKTSKNEYSPHNIRILCMVSEKTILHVVKSSKIHELTWGFAPAPLPGLCPGTTGVTLRTLQNGPATPLPFTHTLSVRSENRK